jgi:hypothetical protein
MSTAARSSTRYRADDGDKQGSKGLWLWIALGVVLLGFVGFLIAWLAGWIRFGTDPRVAEIRSLQQDLQTKFTGGPANEAQAKEMVAAIGTMMQKMNDLPPNLRREAMSGRSFMGGGMQNNVKSYFAAPPEDRKKILDKQIDQMEMMAKAFASSGGMRGGPPGGGPPGGGPPGGGGAGGQAGGPPGGGPPRTGGEDGRNSWRKNMIDRTSPGQRAQFNEYFRAMEERRKERGMGSTPWGPRG